MKIKHLKRRNSQVKPTLVNKDTLDFCYTGLLFDIDKNYLTAYSKDSSIYRSEKSGNFHIAEQTQPFFTTKLLKDVIVNHEKFGTLTHETLVHALMDDQYWSKQASLTILSEFIYKYSYIEHAKIRGADLQHARNAANNGAELDQEYYECCKHGSENYPHITLYIEPLLKKGGKHVIESFFRFFFHTIKENTTVDLPFKKYAHKFFTKKIKASNIKVTWEDFEKFVRYVLSHKEYTEGKRQYIWACLTGYAYRYITKDTNEIRKKLDEFIKKYNLKSFDEEWSKRNTWIDSLEKKLIQGIKRPRTYALTFLSYLLDEEIESLKEKINTKKESSKEGVIVYKRYRIDKIPQLNLYHPLMMFILACWNLQKFEYNEVYDRFEFQTNYQQLGKYIARYYPSVENYKSSYVQLKRNLTMLKEANLIDFIQSGRKLTIIVDPYIMDQLRDLIFYDPQTDLIYIYRFFELIQKKNTIENLKKDYDKSYMTNEIAIKIREMLNTYVNLIFFGEEVDYESYYKMLIKFLTDQDIALFIQEDKASDLATKLHKYVKHNGRIKASLIQTSYGQVIFKTKKKSEIINEILNPKEPLKHIPYAPISNKKNAIKRFYIIMQNNVRMMFALSTYVDSLLIDKQKFNNVDKFSLNMQYSFVNIMQEIM